MPPIQANTLYKRGQSAEAREDYDAAFDSYQKAYAKAPKDLRIRTALYRARIPAAAHSPGQWPLSSSGLAMPRAL